MNGDFVPLDVAATPPSGPAPDAGSGPRPGRPFDVVEILRRAFRTVRHHRALWLFGALVALTGGSGGGGTQYRSSAPDINLPEVEGELPSWLDPSGAPGMPGGAGGPSSEISPGELGTWLGSGLEWLSESIAASMAVIALVCGLLLALIVLGLVVRYVARVALIRMVDGIESGQRPSWREGFRLGWSAATLRLWWLEFLVLLGWLAALSLIALFIGLPLWVLVASGVGTALKVLAGVVSLMLIVPVVIVASLVLSIMSDLWSREIGLRGQPVDQAFTQAWRLLRWRWKDVGMLWLAMIGVWIAAGVVGAILAVLVALPAVAIVFAVWAMSSSVVATVSIVVPLALLFFGLMIFYGGLVEAFRSAAWTLAWLDLEPAR